MNWPVDHGEGIQVLHYASGAEYRAHFDYFPVEQTGSSTHLATGGQRVATLVMYLNNVEQGGETFYPETLVRDAIMALVVVAVLMALAIIYPTTSEGPADPTTTTYNPRPEWYFLFFFQFLKLFPGWLEPVAAVIVPTLALALLVIVPFLDRGLERRTSRRKVPIGLGLLGLAVLGALQVSGTLSAPARPAGEAAPEVIAGRTVYREIACNYCHSITGVGGAAGPDLTNVGGRMSREQIATYLRDPNAMIAHSLHPKLQYTPEELKALAAYLSTLGATVSYSEQAPALYRQHCSACHRVNGQGGTAGPDLSTIGSRRSLTFLEAFTTDPRSVIMGTTMPAFRNVLTREETRDIAAYLFSLKGETKAPAK